MMLLSLEFNKFHLIWGFVLNYLRDLKWSPKVIWNSVDLAREPLKESPGTLLMKSNLDLLFYEQVTGGFFCLLICSVLYTLACGFGTLWLLGSWMHHGPLFLGQVLSCETWWTLKGASDTKELVEHSCAYHALKTEGLLYAEIF